jgi:RHS repeat-associated protein
MPRGSATEVRKAIFGYDDLGRLVNATVGGSSREYDYDDIGNITSLTIPGSDPLVFGYAGDGASPVLTSVGGNTVITDDAGNITDDGQANYSYTPANHLASRTVGGGTSSYTFTADGRRAGMTSIATTLDVVLAPSGERLALIRDGVERDYVWLGGSLVAYFDGPTGEAVHVITDHIGFPLMAVDSAGATMWDPLHEPYGELVGSFSAAADPGLRYPGQWQDEVEIDGNCASGDCTMPGPLDGSVSLFENGYRWYRTAWGRYTQSDPIGLEGGQNLFLYAFANPLRVVDPLGLYGSNDCSYYDRRCRESGGRYYCEVAPLWCDDFFEKYPDPDPDSDNDYEGWPRCVRKCLQDCDEDYWSERRKCMKSYPYGPDNPDPDFDNFWDDAHRACHVRCYTGCASWQWAVVGGDWSREP